MFFTISIIVLSSLAAAAMSHLILWGRRNAPAVLGSARIVRRYSWFERAVHLLGAVGFLTLAATGFGGALLFRGMGGWLLWWHFAGAGVFVVALALMVVRWADENRFEPRDWAWLRSAGGYFRRCGPPLPAGRFDAGQKLFFWCSSTLALVSTVAILLSMFPVFGADGMESLLQVHRYSALALLALVLLHTYVSLIEKSGRLRTLLLIDVDSRRADQYHAHPAVAVAQAIPMTGSTPVAGTPSSGETSSISEPSSISQEVTSREID